MKMYNETRKIMHSDIKLAQLVSVFLPSARIHSESIWVETERPISYRRSLVKHLPTVTDWVPMDNPAERKNIRCRCSLQEKTLYM